MADVRPKDLKDTDWYSTPLPGIKLSSSGLSGPISRITWFIVKGGIITAIDVTFDIHKAIFGHDCDQVAHGNFVVATNINSSK